LLIFYVAKWRVQVTFAQPWFVQAQSMAFEYW